MSAYETVISSLYETKDWGRLEALQEVLEWLDENFSEHEDFSFDFVEDTPYQCPVTCNFESKEQMLQSFKNDLILSNYGMVSSR